METSESGVPTSYVVMRDGSMSIRRSERLENRHPKYSQTFPYNHASR